MSPTLPQSSYSRFASTVSRHVIELEQTKPISGSREWYLLNHLHELNKNVSSASSAKEVANSVKGLSHFAADSLEWSGQLWSRVDEILSIHAALLKAESRK